MDLFVSNTAAVGFCHSINPGESIRNNAPKLQTQDFTFIMCFAAVAQRKVKGEPSVAALPCRFVMTYHRDRRTLPGDGRVGQKMRLKAAFNMTCE